MGHLKGRVRKLESRVGPADTSPIVAKLKCLGGKTFTRKALSDYVRNTPPGFAHPVRGLIAQVCLDAFMEVLEPADGKPGCGTETATGAGEWAVRELDEMIVKGEILWLAEAIKEWERDPESKSLCGANSFD